MPDIIKAIQDTQIPKLLIVAGLLFLLLGFVNKLGGFIEVSSEQKRLTIPIGLLVLTIGLILSLSVATPVTNDPKTGAKTVIPPVIKPDASYVRAVTDDPNPPTNLRSGPGSNYAIVAPIQKNEIFFVDMQVSGDWLPARTSDNKNGYVYRQLVRTLK